MTELEAIRNRIETGTWTRTEREILEKLFTAAQRIEELERERAITTISSEAAVESLGSMSREIASLKRDREWISVSEQMPEMGMNVLACWGRQVFLAVYRKPGSLRAQGEPDTPRWYGKYRPTHWMPIPTPPRGSRNAIRET